MKLLPLFPLQLVLLPDQETMLHVFEPRYKQLFADVLENDIPFGIPFTVNGELKTYGALCTLLKVANRYQSGEMDVLIKAIDVFFIDDYLPQHPIKLYPSGNVTLLNSNLFSAGEKLLMEFKSFAFKFIKAPLTVAQGLTLFQIAAQLQLSDDQKLDLLALKVRDKMERYLLNNLRVSAALLHQELKLQGNYYLN